jgi:hypothetical protein
MLRLYTFLVAVSMATAGILGFFSEPTVLKANSTTGLTPERWPSSRPHGQGTGPEPAPPGPVLLSKTVEAGADGVADIGETITYTYRLTNTNALTVEVLADDDKLGGIITTPVELGPSAGITVIRAYTVQPGDAPGPLINVVTATIVGEPDAFATAQAKVGLKQCQSVTPAGTRQYQLVLGGVTRNIIVRLPSSLPNGAATLCFVPLGQTPLTSVTTGLPSSLTINHAFLFMLLDGLDNIIADPSFSPYLEMLVPYHAGIVTDEDNLRISRFEAGPQVWQVVPTTAQNQTTNVMTIRPTNIGEFILVEVEFQAIYLPIVLRN